MKYTIDYCNGICDEDVANTLEEAKAIADDGAAYTQEDVVIKDETGEEVARRRWWGVPYDPDVTEDEPNEVTEIGGGHYSAWE